MLAHIRVIGSWSFSPPVVPLRYFKIHDQRWMKFGPDKQLHHMDDYIFEFDLRSFQADTIVMQLLSV